MAGSAGIPGPFGPTKIASPTITSRSTPLATISLSIPFGMNGIPSLWTVSS